jgi:hypothetical protein
MARACEEQMALKPIFKRSETDDRPSLHSKPVERGIGIVFLLGAAVAIVGVIYLLSFLGD